MVNSFKLQKSVPAKQQAVGVGILLAILGVVLAFLWNTYAGIGIAVLGIIVAIAGKLASK